MVTVMSQLRRSVSHYVTLCHTASKSNFGRVKFSSFLARLGLIFVTFLSKNIRDINTQHKEHELVKQWIYSKLTFAKTLLNSLKSLRKHSGRGRGITGETHGGAHGGAPGGFEYWSPDPMSSLSQTTI